MLCFCRTKVGKKKKIESLHFTKRLWSCDDTILRGTGCDGSCTNQRTLGSCAVLLDQICLALIRKRSIFVRLFKTIFAQIVLKNGSLVPGAISVCCSPSFVFLRKKLLCDVCAKTPSDFDNGKRQRERWNPPSAGMRGLEYVLQISKALQIEFSPRLQQRSSPSKAANEENSLSSANKKMLLSILIHSNLLLVVRIHGNEVASHCL